MTGHLVPDRTGHVHRAIGRTHPPSIEGVRPVVRSKKRSTAYSAEWRRLVAEAIANGARCVDCGTDRDLEDDHDLPVSRGGLSTRANLAIRCRKHNRAKGNRITRYQLRVPWPYVPPEGGPVGADLAPTSTVSRSFPASDIALRVTKGRKP